MSNSEDPKDKNEDFVIPNPPSRAESIIRQAQEFSDPEEALKDLTSEQLAELNRSLGVGHSASPKDLLSDIERLEREIAEREKKNSEDNKTNS